MRGLKDKCFISANRPHYTDTLFSMKSTKKSGCLSYNNVPPERFHLSCCKSAAFQARNAYPMPRLPTNISDEDHKNTADACLIITSLSNASITAAVKGATFQARKANLTDRINPTTLSTTKQLPALFRAHTPYFK